MSSIKAVAEVGRLARSETVPLLKQLRAASFLRTVPGVGLEKESERLLSKFIGGGA